MASALLAMPPAGERIEVPQQIGPYKIVRQLGAGGMGAVYEAIHTAIARRVALKLLHPRLASTPEFMARFFNEARAVNLIEHPGIVQVSDYGQAPDGTAYLVMELLHGEPLSRRLHRNSSLLAISEVLRLMRQIADALAAAHACGIVHRDLKPDNVMLVTDAELDGGMRTKLIDFGIAKLAPQHHGEHAIAYETAAGAIMGTPVYMAPEQCRGAGEVGPEADVYALGTIIYHMLAGAPPFSAAGLGELLVKQMYETPCPLSERAPDLPTALTELVDAMLQKQPGDRPTMRQVAQHLKEISLPLHLGLQAAPATPAESREVVVSTTLGHGERLRQKALSSRRALAGLALLIIVGAAVGASRSRIYMPRRAATPLQDPRPPQAPASRPEVGVIAYSAREAETNDLGAKDADQGRSMPSAEIGSAPQDTDSPDSKARSTRSPRRKKDIVNEQIRYVR